MTDDGLRRGGKACVVPGGYSWWYSLHLFYIRTPAGAYAYLQGADRKQALDIMRTVHGYDEEQAALRRIWLDLACPTPECVQVGPE